MFVSPTRTDPRGCSASAMLPWSWNQWNDAFYDHSSIRFDNQAFHGYHSDRRGLPEAVGLTSTMNEVNRQVDLSRCLAIIFVLMPLREIQHKLNQTDQHPHGIHDKSHDRYSEHNRSMSHRLHLLLYQDLVEDRSNRPIPGSLQHLLREKSRNYYFFLRANAFFGLFN